MNPIQIRHRLQKGPNYPLEIAYNDAHNVLAASLYDGSTEMFDLSTTSLIGTIPSEEFVISHSQFDRENGFLLWTSTKSGILQCNDIRTNQVVKRFEAHRPILDFDINSSNSMISCGTELTGADALILFYDPRQARLLSAFSECHSDDVTQIQFHPTISNMMMSGSTDGLINLYNLQDLSKERIVDENVETAEDDALYQVIKEDSISKLGYFGPLFEYVYSVTHIETFSIYKFEQGERLNSYGDIRKSTPELQLDYCVGCAYDVDSTRLYLTSGSQK
jgi:WD repeat-containing protein 89